MSKFLEAVDALALTGNEDEAWTIAQQDEGLLPTATRAAWLALAYGSAAYREARA